MTVEESEKRVGCLVQVSDKVYHFGGMVYLLAAAWREVGISGTHDYGVILRDTAGNSTVEMKADEIDYIPYRYAKAQFTPELGMPLTTVEIMSLIGSKVCVRGSDVWLKRIYKFADDYRNIHYEADIQELTAPHTVKRVQLREITRAQ